MRLGGRDEGKFENWESLRVRTHVLVVPLGARLGRLRLQTLLVLILLACSSIQRLVCIENVVRSFLHIMCITFSIVVSASSPCWHFKDGMDQTKFCIPRCRAGVTTKSMAKYERPRVKIQGCWLHSVLLTLHVIDVRQSGDAAMVIECLSQDLEQMYKVCREKGKQPPRRILCWVSWLQ